MRPPCRRLLGVLTAALLITYLGQLPGHLVHHLFDQDNARPACPFFAQAQHTPELQPDTPNLLPPLPIGTLDAVCGTIRLPSALRAPSRSRAPPFPTPSI